MECFLFVFRLIRWLSVTVLLSTLLLQCSSQDLDTLISQVYQPPGGDSNKPGETKEDQNTRGNEQGGLPGTGGNGEEDCVCVAYYLCNNDQIITNGMGLIDIR